MNSREIIFNECKNDINYFAENYYVLKSYDGCLSLIKPKAHQKKFWEVVDAEKFVIAEYDRQEGKTTSALIYAMHTLLSSAYCSILFLVRSEYWRKSSMDSFMCAYDNLPSYMKAPINKREKYYIELKNGPNIRFSSPKLFPSSAFTHVIVDEAAFMDNQKIWEMFEGLWPLVVSGNNTKMIFISSFNFQFFQYGRHNLFYKIWNDAIRGKNKFVAMDKFGEYYKLVSGKK